jgi:hypothetical protein
MEDSAVHQVLHLAHRFQHALRVGAGTARASRLKDCPLVAPHPRRALLRHQPVILRTQATTGCSGDVAIVAIVGMVAVVVVVVVVAAAAAAAVAVAALVVAVVGVVRTTTTTAAAAAAALVIDVTAGVVPAAVVVVVVVVFRLVAQSNQVQAGPRVPAALRRCARGWEGDGAVHEAVCVYVCVCVRVGRTPNSTE